MHQSEQKDALKDMGQMHCGIYEINVFVKYDSGGRLNKKDGLTRYGNSHVKDKTS